MRSMGGSLGGDGKSAPANRQEERVTASLPGLSHFGRVSDLQGHALLREAHIAGKQYSRGFLPCELVLSL